MKESYSFLERIALSAKRLALPLAFAAGMGVVSQACVSNNQYNDGGVDADTDGGVDADTDGEVDPDTVQVTGSATDGPYIDGSKVTIVQLDSSFNPTDKTIIQWTDSLGRYSAELPAKTNFKASISGFHFDEIAGQPSEAPIELLASFRTGAVPDDYNINDVTQLVSDRILHLAETDPGRTFSEYSETARNELFSELDMVLGTPSCQPHEMNVISGSDDCNDYLLAVELLLRQYAHDISSSTGAAVAPTLQNTFNQSALYFGQTKTLPDDIKEGLRAAALNLDVVAATRNLQDYLDAQAESAEAPNADNVLDQDGDGEANSTDPAPLDPDIYTGHCDLDGDGFDALVCGGDDCDDDCDDCFPGGVETCGTARDHDCDGLVDELNGCGDCEVGVPSVVGSVSLSSSGHSIYVLREYALVASELSLQIFNISDSTNPRLSANLELEGLYRLTIIGNELHATTRGAGYYVIDISSPTSPTVIAGPINMGYNQNDIFAVPSERRVYVASDDGISVIDIRDSLDPKLIAGPTESAEDNQANSVFVRDGIIFVADSAGLYLMEYSSGPDLRIISGPVPIGHCTDVFVRENYAFAATTTGVYVVDISSPTAPSIVTGPVLDDHIQELFGVDDQLFALSHNNLSVINISNPLISPIAPSSLVSEVNMTFFISGEQAYIVGSDDGINNMYVVDLDCS